MLNYVIKRLLGLIPTLFIVSVLVFFICPYAARRSGAIDCRARS